MIINDQIESENGTFVAQSSTKMQKASDIRRDRRTMLLHNFTVSSTKGLAMNWCQCAHIRRLSVGICSTMYCCAGENSQSGPPNSSVKRPLKVIQLSLSPKRRKTSNKKQGTIDLNRCAKCQGIYKWAGCDYCERWFHINCVEVSLNKKWKCPFPH